MCGISGICFFDGSSINQTVAQNINDALRHRGPDEDGYYFDPAGKVALGHRRLSIIDLSTGRQPIFNEDGSIAIVFNGEIYNFLELREDLLKKGHRFTTNTDTEVIVHLYEEMGADCVSKLRGMFAFAIWDAPKKELLLARDRIGKKPIYYSVVGQKLYFASEIQALYAISEIKKEIDPFSIDLYLTYSYIPSPHSIFRGIRKLPPAHTLRFSNGSFSISRYWKPAYNDKTKLDYEEAKKELLRLLTESVRLRLISDVPLGAFLSGGVDSSAVVALMSRLSNRPVKTFSIGFQSKTHNELPYARKVAEQYHTEHHEFVVEPNALDVIGHIVENYGEPYGDSSAIPTWYLSKMTREYVTVALNGDGGDELFGGYPWYQAMHAFYKMDRLISPWFRHQLLKKSLPLFPRRIQWPLELLSKSEGARFQSLRSFITPKDRSTLYHDHFREQLHESAEDYMLMLYDKSLTSDYDRSFSADLLSYLPEDLLVKVDRASMAHALECRSPLLDQELIEFSCTLPPSWKINKEGGKVIFKETVQDLFPPGFLNRPKMGFSMPIGEWFRNELKGFVTEKLINGSLTRIPLLKADRLKTILEQHFSGKRNFDSLIWNLLMLSLWFEEYGS
ncbi:MAG: asparagine synthase (glutamine-hydrolyzing) [Candidatus Manganitrophaceae bacterium]|nr:MAG: asparagine synthase (glutamine-hydrolyzing) [Candidatus Manganitrophaceae bacterium]